MTTAYQKTTVKFPRSKISGAVKMVLPKAQKGNFKLRVVNSPIGKMKIVRVVTPAWKSLRPADRIGKVLGAINTVLTREEQKAILRFSVLTPDEYEGVVERKSRAKRVAT